jgi:hypothetical protein
MYATPPLPIAPPRPTPAGRRTYQTDVPEAGAAVVTTWRAGRWETRVEGGPLDGWPIQARNWAEAAAAHRWAVRMAREAAGVHAGSPANAAA